ncbi:hypothetical protein H0H92_010073 [Tricholoma furcatifolium]|nr:hypothetical protein H0H92_010073 [Tricholoma furcatifolium]
MPHQCEFCGQSVPTAQGLRSHIAQNQKCRNRNLKSYVEPLSALYPNTLSRIEHDYIPIHEQGGLQEMDIDPLNEHPTIPQQPPIFSRSRCPTVEDVPNGSDDNTEACWIKDYPHIAGSTYGPCEDSFTQHRQVQMARSNSPWHPFASYDEWKLAQWLVTSGISQNKIDSFLNLGIVHEKVQPSFHNARSLLKRIDSLPPGPEFHCKVLELKGDERDENGEFRTETVELFFRNPLDVIQELLENPVIGKENCYAPYMVFRNEDGSNREYGEMQTGAWWGETQVRRHLI